MGMKRVHDAVLQDAHNVATALCCSCGLPMVPNEVMRCAQCLKAEVSITDGISRQVVLGHCRGCQRYLKPPWVKVEPESRELLGICLKKIKGLGRDVRLTDASYIWTEEHSRRIKVKITVQKEVAASTVLQQSMVVEFQVVNQQCEDCQKSYTPHTWNAVVQVRQKVEHRRTFCYIEQLILKHDVHAKVLSLKESREGLDFHFSQRSHAQHFSDFLESCAPCKQKQSKQLVSHDANSNNYSYKYSIMIELCPVCVDDLVHIPKGHSQLLSGAAPLMLCYKISTAVHLVEPSTLRGYSLPAEQFWKRPFEPVCVRKHLQEFIVLNVEPIDTPEMGSRPKHHLAGRQKFVLAEVEVARACDFGQNDERITVRTHLGHILRPGCIALGYDLRTANLSGVDTAAMEEMRDDIILVRKHYKRRKGRGWELQRLAREAREDLNDEQDMEALQQDLEEDPELRKTVNMFRSRKTEETSSKKCDAPQSGTVEDGAEEEDEEDDAPEVPLAELLEGLTLKEDPEEL
mmetsp:Transcript_42574/g.97639  ORF Transcript_42574/g.97639 Transcript_42574/m.97639 type:complete len:517 (-) Transcript_42574:108-1658(-)